MEWRESGYWREKFVLGDDMEWRGEFELDERGGWRGSLPGAVPALQRLLDQAMVVLDSTYEPTFGIVLPRFIRSRLPALKAGSH